MEEEIIRNKIREMISPELSSIGRWELIISDEDKKPLKGDFSLLKIKEIMVKPNSIIVLINVLKHYSAEVVDLLISEKGDRINTAVIYSETGKMIRKGEVIGIVKISDAVPIEKSRILEFFRKIRSTIDGFENDMGDIFIKSQWPIV
ncbi:MAG: DUF22 domain-containing protein [Archaeoglobaceae archaeon]